MHKKTKKYLSMCLSLALTAASIPFTAYQPVNESEPEATKLSAPTVNCPNVSASDSSDELFSVMTIGASSGQISADGKNVGASYGGFTVDDKNITVNVGGKALSLKEAQEQIGCQVLYNRDGDAIITSPFQKSSIIVKSDKAFDLCGAVSVEEKFEGIFVLTYNSPAEAYSAYKQLSECNDIEYVEANAVVQTLETTPEEDENARLNIKSWGIDEIGTDEFRERLNEEKENLPEVKVAVIDTGIYYEHNAFKGRILDGGRSFVSGDDTIPDDVHGHGSHCAGIICQSTNDNVKILPIQVMDASGRGDNIAIYSGIMYAIEQGVDIISMSIGGYGKSNLLEEAVAAARKKDITVCVAAGNEGFNSVEMYGNLSANEESVVVASVGANHTPSAFSNYGATIDFAAPGEEIRSVGLKGENATVNSTGTSMATPFVAACFADVLSYDINYTSDELYEFMKTNALDICEEGFDEASGWGLVNLRNFQFAKGRVEAPSVSIEGGSYDTAVEIELSSLTENADIYYTLDGSKPTTENGKKYDGKPIKITESTRIRMIAELNGVVSSESTAYYLIDGKESATAFIVEDGVLTSYSGTSAVLDIADMVEKGELPEITSIGESAFYGNEFIEEVTLPDSVKKIGFSAFASCQSLRKFTCKAEEIGMAAFNSCISLEEFIDDSIKSIDQMAFIYCSMLNTLDATKITEASDYAFTFCMALGSESFDFSKLTSIGDGAFADSGITGAVDVSNAGTVGSMAFMETFIEEVTLSDKITILPDLLFMNCAMLTKISAPSVMDIGMYALALNKYEYSEETMVDCDINFSNILTIGDCGFKGYVFNKPVTFMKLDPATAINVFAEAYGESISLPTILSVWSSPFSADFEELSRDFKVNELYLQNATEFIDKPVLNCNALILGSPDKEEEYSCIFYDDCVPESGTILTYSYDEEIANICENAYIGYGTIPYIMAETSAEAYNFFTHQEAYINVYGIGKDSRSVLYSVDSDGEETYFHSLSGTPVKVPTEEAGTYNYVIKQTDYDDNLLNSRTIVVNVTDAQEKELPVNEYTVIPLDATTLINNHQHYITYKFTPEKTDTYKIFGNGIEVSVNSGDTEIANLYAVMAADMEIELEGGKEYEFRVRCYVEEDLIDLTSNEFYISVNSSDNAKKSLNTYNSAYSVDFSGFDGSEDFKPVVEVYYEGEELVEGVDYEFELNNETVSFGLNGYTIKGIGDYFGTLINGMEIIDPFIGLNEQTDIHMGEQYRFIPETDGLYKVILRPTEDAINTAIGDKTYLAGSQFIPDVSITKATDDEYNENDFEAMLAFLTENMAKPVSVSGDSTVFTVKFEAGQVYNVAPSGTDVSVLITENTTHSLSECTFSCERNYQYEGEAVIPEITVKNNKGQTLTEGKDYKVRLINNDKPGIMFAYIEGSEQYPGAKPLLMLIDDGTHNMYISDELDKPVIVVEPDQPFTAIEGFTYGISLSETANVYMTCSDEELSPSAEVMNFENGNNVIFSVDYPSTIPAGFNIFTISGIGENTEAELTFNIDKETFAIENATIVCNNVVLDDISSDIEDLKPEITVTYEGKELVEDVDYLVDYMYDATIGINSAIISGIGNYAGFQSVSYLVTASYGLDVITDSATPISVEEPFTSQFFEWTPEKEKYNVSCTTDRLVNVAIYNSEKELLWDCNVTSRFNEEIYVEPGQKYFVSVTPEIAQEFSLVLNSEKLLSDCAYYGAFSTELTGENIRPDIEFRDNDDNLLVEDVDYTLLNDCYIEDLGLREYVYRGCGEYSGEVTVHVVGYTSTRPDAEFVDISEGFTSIISSELSSGERGFFKFTSVAEGEKEYNLSITQLQTGMPSYRASILIYNEEGELTGINPNSITLNENESAYFVVVNPYVVDNAYQNGDISTAFTINAAPEFIPEETTTTTGTSDVIISTTTTVATTDEPVTETTESTSQTSTQTTATPTGTSTAVTTTTVPPVSKDIPLGDANEDGIVDANDASFVLAEYALLSTGGESSFTDKQRKAADVDNNDMVDASDASLILAFYAYLSTGGEISDMGAWLETQ